MLPGLSLRPGRSDPSRQLRQADLLLCRRLDSRFGCLQREVVQQLD